MRRFDLTRDNKVAAPESESDSRGGKLLLVSGFSVDFEAETAEVIANLVCCFGRWWLRVFQLVFESQALPLIRTKLVEGKNLNTVNNVLPSQDDLSDSTNILRIIGEPGN